MKPSQSIGDGRGWTIPLFLAPGFLFWGLIWLLERLFS